ncbi:AraC family transcriptional regulator [Streptomyces xanthochromogenes]|uniref:helix-turn-helix transcriptional regulator n=1 Tax=Streptomyces xanthochromogenes TaxID=67384 RepID=UPI003818305E
MPGEPTGGGDHMGVESFEQWREALGRSRAAEMTSAHAGAFKATVRHARMGPVATIGTSFPSLHVKRTAPMIRRCDDEVYHVTMLTAGLGIVSGSSSAPTQRLSAGQMHLVASSEAYESRFWTAPDIGPEAPAVEGIGLDLPMSLLPVSPRRIRQLVGRALPTEQGVGSILAAFLLALDRQMLALRPADSGHLGTMAVDLLATFVTRELDNESVLPQETRLRTMLHEVRFFVRQHLHDPELTPSTIAAAHHVSLSYLHRSFTHDSGTTLAAFIRRQRLQKAYHDLADPSLRALPIHVIAARCGLVQAPTFTRAFKAVYGISPSDHRREASAQQARPYGQGE